jgi:hypothetical protein
MSLNIIILTGFFYLIPGTVELFRSPVEESGNMGRAGVYLDIQYKRNFVYITAFSSIFFSFTKMFMLRYFFYSLFLFANYSYFVTIKKWIAVIS